MLAVAAASAGNYGGLGHFGDSTQTLATGTSARLGESAFAFEGLASEKRLFSDARLVITTVARVATALVG